MCLVSKNLCVHSVYMFNKNDFENPEVLEKLRLIIMEQLKLPLMQNFHLLDESKKVQFNGALNTYIHELPEKWEEIVNADFGSICKNKLFNEKFRAEDHLPKKIENSIETAEVFPPVLVAEKE